VATAENTQGGRFALNPMRFQNANNKHLSIGQSTLQNAPFAVLNSLTPHNLARLRKRLINISTQIKHLWSINEVSPEYQLSRSGDTWQLTSRLRHNKTTTVAQ